MSATSGVGLPDIKPVGGFVSHGEIPHASGLQSKGNHKGPEKTISCVSCRKRKLKCDRVKPKCGTCTRLRHECEYPERRRNLGSKRRNIKELEARLAQVETQLVAESKSNANSETTSATALEADWSHMGIDMNIDMANAGMLGSFDTIHPGLNFAPVATPTVENIFGRELLSLGLSEPLPSQDAINELYEIYFTSFHPTMPIMHRTRFYASLDRAPHSRPPACLMYAMWTLAASLSPKYEAYEDVFYERARKYMELAEMKGHGESFVSLYHAQTWGLICNYEARKMYFSRSWMSTGRMVRMVQMLGLWRLDHDESDAKQTLQPPKDWVELEERRRTFWAAFYSDRFASSGSGWPMIIQEHEIFTNLPSSEEAFESGIAETATTLAQALTPEGASRLSNYGGVLLTAAYFGHFFQHVRGTGPSHHPEDIQNGEFWKRHRRMENALNNTFIYLPESLRLPNGVRDMNVIFIHMNIQASIIGLHRTAVMTAGRYNVDPIFVRQSQARTFMAAEEIVSILNQTRKEDSARMVPWVGFCLYVAAGIFLNDLKSESPNSHSLTNLDQILIAMRSIGAYHTITKGFLTQCELDIEAIGKNRFGRDLNESSGIITEGQGVPITVADMQALLLQPPEPTKQSPAASTDFAPGGIAASNNSLSPPPVTLPPESSAASAGSSPITSAPEFQSWDSRVETRMPARFEDVTYRPKYAQGSVTDSNNFVGYPHTTTINSRSEPSAVPGREYSYEPSPPLNFIKSPNGLPIHANGVTNNFHLSNEWSVPENFQTIDHVAFVPPLSNNTWSPSRYPAAGLARGGGG
ncbi:BgTH12-00823 [Blumeria graminis f. sp. triticale]|uniref:BgtA-20647 n=3 Tax=Blumeria graminis TaxID=34373 RepID=A0A9X9MMP4_BLUGR|nr:hypothetical protein BGT96224_A20647 [Blumeria graminis f. sp. tritici 96224]CAD6505332.1 BgTH12-00823 [Blumeria graminis f. sp. triticale]VDB93347.1 BgtA-20647 [Blumeria graminis f. sp. tritici]